MGQKNSSNLPTTLTPDLLFLKQLIHPAYGDISIYRSSETLDYIAVRTFLKDSKTFESSLISRLTEYQNSICCDFLTKLLSFENHAHKELCSNYHKISMIFEFFPKTLSSEILTRKHQNETFQEFEVLNLFLAILSALNALKNSGFNYSNLNPNNILLSRSGLCKLTPIEDLTGISGYKSMFISSKESLYKSPEELASIKEKLENPVFLQEKCNVFSLAIILLEVSSLKEIDGLYDISNYTVKIEEIKRILIDSSINDNFKFLLHKMLDFEPENRPFFQELIEEMNDYKDNFLGIKLNCYSLKDTSDFKEELNEEIEPHHNISVFNDETQLKNKESLGFSGYLGKENDVEMRTPVLNPHENIAISDRQRESFDVNNLRNRIDKIVNEALNISEEIQKKYQILTNKKSIFPDDFEKNFVQNSLIFNQRNNVNTPKGSAVINQESSTSISKDYHYFTRNNPLSMSPLLRNTLENNTESKSPIKNSLNGNLIRNFDYDFANAMEKNENNVKIKMKSFRNSPMKRGSVGNEKKYYTPKRDHNEKMKMGGSSSVKKTTLLKERPVTPSYEVLYWEALKRKF